MATRTALYKVTVCNQTDERSKSNDKHRASMHEKKREKNDEDTHPDIYTRITDEIKNTKTE